VAKRRGGRRGSVGADNLRKADHLCAFWVRLFSLFLSSALSVFMRAPHAYYIKAAHSFLCVQRRGSKITLNAVREKANAGQRVAAYHGEYHGARLRQPASRLIITYLHVA